MSRYYDPSYGKNKEKVNYNTPKSSGKETTEPQTGRGKLKNTKYLKVRDSPNIDGNVIGILDEHDRFEIIGRIGKFYKIVSSTFQNSDSSLYVFSDYVSLERG